MDVAVQYCKQQGAMTVGNVYSNTDVARYVSLTLNAREDCTLLVQCNCVRILRAKHKCKMRAHRCFTVQCHHVQVMLLASNLYCLLLLMYFSSPMMAIVNIDLSMFRCCIWMSSLDDDADFSSSLF